MPDLKDREIEARAERILLDASALSEDPMRLALLARRLSGVEPETAALVLASLYRRGAQEGAAGSGGRGAARVLLSALVDHNAFTAALGRAQCMRIYMAAIRLGLTRVSRLFTDLPPRRSDVHGYESEEEAAMELITLGERRSMARSRARETLDRLLSDPDPVVVANLLDNPRLTEREVLKIASKRPNSAPILTLVARHRVWSRRRDVVRAVVQNPYTPPRTAAVLLEFMLTQDLKRVARDKTLHAQVRSGAAEILYERGVECPHPDEDRGGGS